MARKKKGHSNDTDELWSRTFDENEGYTNGNYSRTERKKADKAISPVLKSLWIFLALFIILPTSAYIFYTHNAQNTTEPETEKLVVKENESSESSQAEESESESMGSESEEVEESKAVQSESETTQAEAASSEPESAASSKVVESESQSVQESTVSEESTEVVESQTTNTYTVKAGDNLYRIALNHGMSTDQLKSLNGLTTDEVSVGTTLVVN